jgi:hypothetical protein
MTFKYFVINENETIDSLKKQYRKLAFKHHPDCGGTVEAMQEVNAEYEKAIKAVGEIQHKNYTIDYPFIDLIDKLIKLHMQGINIEICGWFVYISGNTKDYKDTLRALGLHWNSTKLAWYFKPDWYQKQGNDIWSMDRIRASFGSQTVNNNTNETAEERQRIAG